MTLFLGEGEGPPFFRDPNFGEGRLHLDHMSPCKECPQTAPKSAQKEQTSTAIDFGFENEQTIPWDDLHIFAEK